MTKEFDLEQHIHLKEGGIYRIGIKSYMIRFNAKVYWLKETLLCEGGQISLTEGEEVIFLGTLDKLKLTSDLDKRNLLFKPGEEIKDRYRLNENNLLLLNKFGVKLHNLV